MSEKWNAPPGRARLNPAVMWFSITPGARMLKKTSLAGIGWFAVEYPARSVQFGEAAYWMPVL